MAPRGELLDALEDLPFDPQTGSLFGVSFHALALFVEDGEVEARAGVAGLACTVEDPGSLRQVLIDDPRAAREVVRAERPACAKLLQITGPLVSVEGSLDVLRCAVLLEDLGQRRAAFPILLLTPQREVLGGPHF